MDELDIVAAVSEIAKESEKKANERRLLSTSESESRGLRELEQFLNNDIVARAQRENKEEWARRLGQAKGGSEAKGTESKSKPWVRRILGIKIDKEWAKSAGRSKYHREGHV